jgi:hypothetical protein
VIRALLLDAEARSVRDIALTGPPLDFDEIRDIIGCVHLNQVVLDSVLGITIFVDGARTHGDAGFKLPGHHPTLGCGVVVGLDANFHHKDAPAVNAIGHIGWWRR